MKEQEDELKKRDSFIKILEQELSLAKQRHYGRKSEKTNGEAQQYDLFDEASVPDNFSEVESTDEEITITHTRKKPGRKGLPKDLPRISVVHDLSEEEKQCDCGCEMTKIGETKTEQLEIIPAKVRIIENIKYTYACKKCESSIKTSKMPPQPIPKSIATPGLLAYVATAKFCDHLPLYRQEAIFKRMNVNIARNTLSHWMIQLSLLLRPLYNCLLDVINAYDVSYADETRIQVLKEKDRPPDAQSYMWCFIGGPPEKRSIIYHYNVSRAHHVVEEILPDFKGYLHCDGYGAYDTYAADHETKLSACWMHCRRKFYEVTKIVKSEGLAIQAVRLIGKLYKVEAKIKEQKLVPSDIKLFREKHSKPILSDIKKFVEKNMHKVLPKSPLGKAFSYAKNQWEKLIVYVEDGRLEIDNGLTERKIKPFVIGRKNYLFCNSVAGAQAAEILYSLIETCKLHNIEPYAYLKEVSRRMPMMETLDEVEALLPFNIALEES